MSFHTKLFVSFQNIIEIILYVSMSNNVNKLACSYCKLCSEQESMLPYVFYISQFYLEMCSKKTAFRNTRKLLVMQDARQNVAD